MEVCTLVHSARRIRIWKNRCRSYGVLGLSGDRIARSGESEMATRGEKDEIPSSMRLVQII